MLNIIDAIENLWNVNAPVFISPRYFLVTIAVVAHAIVANKTNRSPIVPNFSRYRLSILLVVTSKTREYHDDNSTIIISS